MLASSSQVKSGQEEGGAVQNDDIWMALGFLSSMHKGGMYVVYIGGTRIPITAPFISSRLGGDTHSFFTV